MNLTGWVRNYERVFNKMNLNAWSENYKKVFGLINFNVKEWVKNYEEKILKPRVLRKEIERLEQILEKYKKERRQREKERREKFNKMRIRHQNQEFEAIKRVRGEERPRDIPLYCAAPSGGAFDIDEAVAPNGLYSLPPTNEWLDGFQKRSQKHKTLLERGESLFMMMRDNIDEGFFED